MRQARLLAFSFTSPPEESPSPFAEGISRGVAENEGGGLVAHKELFYRRPDAMDVVVIFESLEEFADLGAGFVG